MIAQLNACHLARNSYLIGSVSVRTRNCGQHHKHTVLSGYSRPNSTTAAAARPSRRGGQGDSWNGLGALLSNNQLPQAVELLESCLDSSRRVHGVKTGELLEALCAAGQHSTVWSLLRRITASKGRLPLQVLHRLLKLAGQFGTVDDVLAVYQHQQQLYGFASAGVQTTLIHALLKAHSRAQPGHLLAYEAWGRLNNSGKQLDAQSLLAGVHACVSVGKFRQAEALLEPLKAAAGAVGRPMVSAYNLILKGHVAADNLEAARRTFAAMTSRGLAADAVTYNTLISGFVRAGDMARAQSLLRSMQVEGVVPDGWTFTTLALGYGRQGQLQEMHDVVQQMQQAGVSANSATYAAAIDALVSSGQLQEAEHLLQQLLDNQTDILSALSTSSSGSSSSSNFNSGNGTGSSSTGSSSSSGSAFQTMRARDSSSRQAGRPPLPTAVAPAATPSAAAAVAGNGAAGADGQPAQATASGREATQQQQRQLPPLQPPPPLQQQQQQSVAAATRNREQVLRQQYNALIKGWLQVAAAQASAQDEQRWLAGENGSSSSSSGSSTPIAVSSAPEVPSQQQRAGWQSGSMQAAAGGNDGYQQQQRQAPAPALLPVQQRQQQEQVLVAAGTAQQQQRRQQIQQQQLGRQMLAQQQQQPALRRVGVGLVRPVLPQQPVAVSANQGGVAGVAASIASTAPSTHQQQQQEQQARPIQQQQQQQQQPTKPPDAASSNGNGQPSPVAAAATAAAGLSAAVSGRDDPFRAAVAVMQQMQAAGVQPAADTYTLFVNYCIKVGDARKLQQLLDAATAAGVQPDQVMLTTLIKAAWQADAHGAAVETFNALLRITGSPAQRSSSSTVASSSTGSAAGSTSSAATQQQQQLVRLLQVQPQQQQQGRAGLATSLRAYAQAAGTSPLPSSSARVTPAADSTPAPSTTATSQQQLLQLELEQQLQQQMVQARQQQQQQEPDGSSSGKEGWEDPAPSAADEQEQQWQLPRRSPGQLLLPLSAPVGPDTAAWNALVVALVRAGKLEDAAAALERSTQASAAAGASRPPVQGYSALIRGYRRAGLKHQAVGLLRQFLNLGGQPGRVMCDDVIGLCLEAKDIKTARQVVRAMELTGCLDADGSSFYDGWFRRWEVQQQQALLPRHLQQSSRGSRASSNGGPNGDAGQQQQQDGKNVSAPVAVERLKWWLGLPNKYYRGMEGSIDSSCTRD